MAMQPAIVQANSQKQILTTPFLLSTPSTKLNDSRFASFSLAKPTTFRKLKACASTKSETEARPLAYFPPTVWGDRLASLTFNQPAFELLSKQVELLNEKIKKEMLNVSTSDLAEKIILIDSLCRLGVSYHFEEEIQENLTRIFNTQPNFLNEKDYDLFTVAVIFRVFRQHGFKISSDVFNKFKDSDGKFKESLLNDIKGILSLFEATHVSMPNEPILDEALAFTKAFLESSAVKSFPNFAKHISSALEQPVHKGIPRLEARKYIDLYEVDESRNETVLELAKLDFNRVQLLHQEELSQFSKWWKSLNISAEVPYARNRMAEIFFWAVSMYFEPQYAKARMIVSKVVLLISLIDDTIDAYATIDEIHRVADAIERWDMRLVDQLPNYMKVIYRLIINTFDEFEKDLEAEGKSYSVKYGREAYQELVRGYYLEAIWKADGKVPSFDEYIYNGGVTTGLPLVATVSFMGVKEIKGTEALEWLKTYPKLNQAGGEFIRLVNDITSHETEQDRGHVSSCIDCYMNQYGVSKKKAMEEMQKMAINEWKKVNEQLIMRPTEVVPVDLLMRIVNLVRLTDVSYKYGDGYTDSKQLKEYVKGLFLEPIPI
ncbi:casbene synthase, chloroplastic-like [Jatropha curcas]|uniref:casbene synthase, chloroplastic-like n=1 Tax=Jatropha curcas TaxID=180498 RepID=UPI0018931897|nr:casbene synthase, chloroplastic-like [Jatropha curcas]